MHAKFYQSTMLLNYGYVLNNYQCLFSLLIRHKYIDCFMSYLEYEILRWCTQNHRYINLKNNITNSTKNKYFNNSF